MERSTAAEGEREPEEPGWEVDPEDEQGAAIVAFVGRQLRARREAAGMRAAEFAAAMGYGEGLVYKVEGGTRIPRAEYLDKADEVLGAGGSVAAMKGDVAEARYPKRVRDLARMEAQAVELTAYGNHNLHGLLQTREYARALFAMRRPALEQERMEQLVAARLARQSVFERKPAPALNFVQEEVTLRRPVGGKLVLRRQLERLLELAELRAVEIQVMPTAREDHAGMSGEMQVLKFRDGTAVGRSEGEFGSRPVSELKQLRIIELRCGIIRAQALAPGESKAFIEQVLGET
ncbi:XRE family transcriptional regulator [Streptomyces alfalfae]|uniref:Transcriptional regulator n=1 Tax=Streptomyces alfalfae TaxID=1642299 RepID=A0ABM6GTE9_9ACTN|nr:helix-turn-helix transcriptional regulator [Streptomyces alfalfae]AYA17270.1 XRE family transcriptional regulator [Streptomyces fradiae]APY86875.1 transcriptional regulator [Streptomyces alfalfae]QUI33353.1 helix-turn-helix transcriptional regulator [Streptomyces alfalfae]RXX37524.1 XRE family transcriptional regulator [Streptomyces alfalfae]RZM99342.1 XRE family transcriptional regulator [Streptomyces alfalfae]